MEMTLEESQRSYLLAQDRRQRVLEKRAARDEQEAGKRFFRKILKICIILDIIEVVSLGTVGWLTGQAGDIYLYLKTKQTKAGREQMKKMAVAYFGKAIPIVNVLPFRALFWIWKNPLRS